jgi:hypothetical protein
MGHTYINRPFVMLSSIAVAGRAQRAAREVPVTAVPQDDRVMKKLAAALRCVAAQMA